MSAPEVPPHLRVLQLLSMDYVVQAIGTFARLGCADHMTPPRTAGELAREVHAHEPSLYRLLRTLSAVGIVQEHDGGRFGLTTMGATLKSGPGSMRAVAAYHQHPVFWAATGAMYENVKTGQAGFRAAHGQGLFEKLRTEAEAAKWFDEAMSTFSTMDVQGVPPAYDFKAMRKVVDVGGGQGNLLRAILQANPHLRGTLFDQEHNVQAAKPRFQAAGLDGRADFVGGDFFKKVPEGGDAYTIANVLQDWSDERATSILRTTREAMGPHAKLLVVEIIIEPGPRGTVGKLVDISNMIAGGRTRTVDEHRVLLAQAGLRLQRVVPTTAAVSILEAVPA